MPLSNCTMPWFLRNHMKVLLIPMIENMKLLDQNFDIRENIQYLWQQNDRGNNSFIMVYILWFMKNKI